MRNEIDPQESLVLILGVDAFSDFCKWHRYDDILSLSHIMILQRPGYTLPERGCEKELYDSHITDQVNNIKEMPNGSIYLCNEEKIDISSTSIRQCIAESEQPKYLLPGSVWHYIRRNNMYK